VVSVTDQKVEIETAVEFTEMDRKEAYTPKAGAEQELALMEILLVKD